MMKIMNYVLTEKINKILENNEIVFSKSNINDIYGSLMTLN